MKKILAIIVIPYLVVIGVVFYFYFGPGIVAGYETLKWKEIQVNVPKNFKVREYERDGWEVYNQAKFTLLVRIARKSPAIDVSRLPKHKQVGRVLYRFAPGPDSIYYISNPRRTHEVVFARNIADTTLYFKVASPSVFSAAYVMEKITAGCTYQGRKITPPKPSIPLGAYLTDFIFLGGMTVPLIIIILIFSLSGRKPAERHFLGDPIRCEENFVSFTRVQRFRRKNTFCYLVLTVTRLMVFVFKKPVLEIKLDREKPDIKIQGKKIIIQRAEEKIILKPSNIEKWKDQLSAYLY
jgi:hypothetical protein